MAVRGIRRPAAGHLAGDAIHGEIGEFVHLVALGLGAAQEGAHTGEQFFQVERFDQVIIGAGIETLDAILDGILGGQHQDGQTASHAQAAADLEPVHAGQHPVQDDQVGVMIVGQIQSGATFGGDVDQVAFIGKAALEHFQDGRVIFDDQDAFIHFAPLFKIYHNLLVE